MQKQSVKKVVAPSPPSSTYSPTPVDEFLVGRRVCEVFLVKGPTEDAIDTKTLIARGKEAGANMSKKDAEDLRKHQDEIPSKYSQSTFVFPVWNNEEDEKDDKRVRGLNKLGVDWWCVMKFPSVGKCWDNSYKLVRFRDLPLLLPAKTIL